MNVFDDIQFYLFNHHHYIDEPADSDRYDSTWVNYPNAQLRPRGRATSSTSAGPREMLLAEELGFDAIAINEHHQTIYSMQPATSACARRYLAALTKRVKILVAGVPINLSCPIRVAEEYAMLDVMSNGRMEFALPARHGHGVLVQRRPDQPDHGARALPREPRGHPQDAGPRTARSATTASSTTTATSTRGRGRCRSRTRRSTSSARAARRPSTSPSTPTPATRSCSCRSSSSSGDGQLPRGRRGARAGRSSPTTVVTVVHGVRRRHRRGGGARGAPAHREVLLAGSTASRRSSSRRPGTCRAASSCAAPSRPRWPTARARRGTTWSPSGASSAARPTRWPTRSSHWAQEAQCSRMLMVLQHGDMPEWKAVKNMHMFAKEVIPRVRARVEQRRGRPRSWRG